MTPNCSYRHTTPYLFRISAIIVLFISLIQAQQFDASKASRISGTPARHSEEWIRHAVIYEIYPRAFSAEGTFAGIERKLPELKSLGVTVLWIMPVHPVGIEKRKGKLGSPYSVRDYYAINPEFGTLKDFKHLVDRSHRMGFHLIMDLVANHTSWDSQLIHDHPEWFTKDSAGNIVSPVPDWSDVADLNYSNSGLRQYMITMMKYWVEIIGIDGFRCDVADMVPLDFWEEARASLDSIKPVLMLSESARPDHHERAFDLTYSWNLYGLLAKLISGSLSAQQLGELLHAEDTTYPIHSLLLRFSSNHDENAWDNSDVVKFGERGAKLAAVIVNTIPGVPLVYNGQEAGNTQKLPLFEKTTITWNDTSKFRQMYVSLFKLRRLHPALSGESWQTIQTNNDSTVYAFERAAEKDTLIIVYNFSRFPFTGVLNFSNLKLFTKSEVHLVVAFTGEKLKFRLTNEKRVAVKIPKTGYRIFVVE